MTALAVFSQIFVAVFAVYGLYMFLKDWFKL